MEGAGLLIGAISMMCDLGASAEGVLRAEGIVARCGLRKVKHVDIRNMSIQDVARSGRIAPVKIPGAKHAAAVLT